MFARLCFAVMLCGAGALSALAQEGREASELILESYGVYCGMEGPSSKVAAPGTVLGYIQVTDADAQATVVTTRVPAAMGIAFGVALRVAPDQSGFSAEFRVTHPTATPGARITERWISRFSPNEPTLNRFRFEFAEELNIGLWVMEVYHEEALLFRQAFEVVPQDAAADILAQCAGFAPVS